MEKIYIAFVDTPELFASALHGYLKQKYIHVLLSLDENLDEAYSFGRRNPAVPLVAGYEREDKERILRSFPDADYMIGAIDCTAEQKEQIREKMRLWYEHRWRYHYAVMELPFIAMGRAVHRSRHFTCSSFAAKFLSDAGITSFAKDESLVTPKDFYEWDGYTCIFRGKLRELVEEEPVRERAMLLAGTETVYEG